MYKIRNLVRKKLSVVAHANENIIIHRIDFDKIKTKSTKKIFENLKTLKKHR